MERNGNPDLEQLLARFGSRLGRSAAHNRGAIGYRFFRRLPGHQEYGESEALRHGRRRDPRRMWSLLPFIPVERRESRKSRAIHERGAPTVVVIDQTGRTVEGPEVSRRAGARVELARAVAAFVLGCMCGVLFAQLHGPDLAEILVPEREVRVERPPAVVGAPAATRSPTEEAIFTTAKTAQAPCSVGSQPRKSPTVTRTPKSSELARPEPAVTRRSDPAWDAIGAPSSGPSHMPEFAPSCGAELEVTVTPEGPLGASPSSSPAPSRMEYQPCPR
jgi:hypothetical protein